MGQYQHWLHLREQAQLIRTQINTLTAELADLQAYVRSLEETENGAYQNMNIAENELFRLLSLATRPLFPWDRASVAGSHASSSSQQEPVDAPQPVKKTDQPVPSASPVPFVPPAPLPPLPHPEITLLPEDMAAFFDEHTRTDPQMRQPWWQQDAASATQSSPIDQKSERNREEIERWLARWGRQSLQHISQGGETHE